MKKLRGTASWICLLITVGSLLFVLPLSAQQGLAQKITGKIVVQGTGFAVSGATVSVRGTSNLVMSGSDGTFSIMAAPGETLIISNVGYSTREVRVGLTTTIRVELTQTFSHLEDVVVVGYGRMKKTNLSSAVNTISNTDLNKTVNVTLDDALRGKAPNVYVSASSGAPGAGAAVIIRGVSTITGNYQPLYVIDGIQIRPSMATGGAYNSTQSLTNQLSGINMD